MTLSNDLFSLQISPELITLNDIFKVSGTDEFVESSLSVSDSRSTDSKNQEAMGCYVTFSGQIQSRTMGTRANLQFMGLDFRLARPLSTTEQEAVVGSSRESPLQTSLRP